MLNRILFFVILVLGCGTLHAQQVSHRCGFDHWMQQIHAQNPQNARALHRQFDEWIQHSRQQHRDDEVYQVPVVFHIVYNNEDHNLHDSVIYSQLEVLNEDYRRGNANAIETRSEFLPVAADVGIEFVLAEYDPEGNPTTGIVRVPTDVESFSLSLFDMLDAVKSEATGGSDAWDTDHYLNIWVCNISGGLWGQVFGIAYPPVGAPNWPEGTSAPDPGKEGVVIHYPTLGRNNPHHFDDGVAENNQGRTLVHEIGHYFGLRHIWGDANIFSGEDGCEVDDGFADTPNCAASANFVCDYAANTCTDSPEDFPNMIENYMDYSQDACMNMFTLEQADMMRFALTELRPGLLNSPALGVSSTANRHVKVFPNPANSEVAVSSASVIDRVEVLDYTGRLLKVQPSLHGNQVQLSVTDLVSGSYLLRIYSGDDAVVRRFVKR